MHAHAHTHREREKPRPRTEPSFKNVLIIRKEECLIETLLKYQAIAFLRRGNMMEYPWFIKNFNLLEFGKCPIWLFVQQVSYKQSRCHECDARSIPTHHAMSCITWDILNFLTE
jgi:hypothetical protein